MNCMIKFLNLYVFEFDRICKNGIQSLVAGREKSSVTFYPTRRIGLENTLVNL